MKQRIAKIIVFLLIAGPLLALLHMALIPHFYNGATGEWEHPRPGAAPIPDGSRGLRAVDRETCEIYATFLNQTRMWVLAAAIAALVAVLLTVNSPQPASAPFDHKLTLALAPKNSPPTSA
jgi:hypothetical protein